PEVVKGELHGEKADVWAAGCILEQMATLSPPVYSTNMPSPIVGAVYEPVPEGLYSEKVSFTIKSCLTPHAEARPDIVEVSSLLPDVMMKYLEFLSTSHLMLEKKLGWERRRTQQYFMEKNDEKLSLHHSSSGEASCKSEFSENTKLPVYSCQSAHGKDEERTYEAILVFSLNDNEIDIVDNSSSSSSSNLKESAIVKRSFFALLVLLLPSTASAGIAVSQRRVHQISDPVQQILVQLHKIILSTRLPPALQCNLKRRIVARFKKSLFSQKSNPCKLKSEIKKVWYTIYYLWSNAAELIELNIFTADWHEVHLSSGGNMLLPDDGKGKQSIIIFGSGIYFSNKMYSSNVYFSNKIYKWFMIHP
uniref:Uncharacterized protein n=1 Tax=Geospiza parvula TaxID=87175 RepID=A0A8U8BHC8_GEOPR